MLLVGQGLVARVVSVHVGHDIRDACFGGRIDESLLRVALDETGEGDDEELLSLQGLYKSGLVGIVNLDTADSVWKRAAAASTCKGGDLVLAI